MLWASRPSWDLFFLWVLNFCVCIWFCFCIQRAPFECILRCLKSISFCFPGSYHLHKSAAARYVSEVHRKLRLCLSIAMPVMSQIRKEQKTTALTSMALREQHSVPKRQNCALSVAIALMTSTEKRERLASTSPWKGVHTALFKNTYPSVVCLRTLVSPSTSVPVSANLHSCMHLRPSNQLECHKPNLQKQEASEWKEGDITWQISEFSRVINSARSWRSFGLHTGGPVNAADMFECYFNPEVIRLIVRKTKTSVLYVSWFWEDIWRSLVPQIVRVIRRLPQQEVCEFHPLLQFNEAFANLHSDDNCSLQKVGQFLRAALTSHSPEPGVHSVHTRGRAVQRRCRLVKATYFVRIKPK